MVIAVRDSGLAGAAVAPVGRGAGSFDRGRRQPSAHWFGWPMVARASVSDTELVGELGRGADDRPCVCGRRGGGAAAASGVEDRCGSRRTPDEPLYASPRAAKAAVTTFCAA